ncbi:MAG: hypothetical protein PHE33_09060, partial [Bacteroidales bacterium]|nr:hypothetical protein [Bacteroidales bacterium]
NIRFKSCCEDFRNIIRRIVKKAGIGVFGAINIKTNTVVIYITTVSYINYKFVNGFSLLNKTI